MRHFTDAEDEVWDVIIGRESWGAPVLLFSPRGGEGVRQAPLGAETMLEASQRLAELSEDELRARLADARDWAG